MLLACKLALVLLGSHAVADSTAPTLKEIENITIVVRSVVDLGAEKKEYFCDIKENEAMALLPLLQKESDTALARIKTVSLKQVKEWNKCQLDCSCSIYDRALANLKITKQQRKIQRTIVQKAKKLTQEQAWKCADKLSAQVCSSALLKNLRLEAQKNLKE
jgi:hypothetical protein